MQPKIEAHTGSPAQKKKVELTWVEVGCSENQKN
jgi:hypothetical protein